jgi:hypothetical protein
MACQTGGLDTPLLFTLQQIGNLQLLVVQIGLLGLISELGAVKGLA